MLESRHHINGADRAIFALRFLTSLAESTDGERGDSVDLGRLGDDPFGYAAALLLVTCALSEEWEALRDALAEEARAEAEARRAVGVRLRRIVSQSIQGDPVSARAAAYALAEELDPS